jgi:site-specific DNA recombinase
MSIEPLRAAKFSRTFRCVQFSLYPYPELVIELGARAGKERRAARACGEHSKVYKAHELVYAGELITCGHCGRPVTGEIVEKKSSGKFYTYYRCARYTAQDHPRVRLREEQIDKEFQALFNSIRQPQPVQDWFRTTLMAMSGSQQAQSRARCSDVQKQLDETRRQQERLLNLHLSGNLDEATFALKNMELRDRHATLKLELEVADRGAAENIDKALRMFELSQSLPEKWVKSDYTEKRQIIEMVCLNLVLKGTSLCIATRKPFNALVEGLKITESGERGIRTPGTGISPYDSLANCCLQPLGHLS